MTTSSHDLIAVDASTRAGRMLAAGRLTATFRSPTGTHITLTAKCRKPNDSGKWIGCPLSEAVVVFFEVPNQTGWNDRVAKLTRSKGIVVDPNADPARAWCVKQLLAFVAGQPTATGLEVFEEECCGRCGRALTDPVSIERGIGPECYGMLTGSEHETKVKAAKATKPAPVQVIAPAAPSTPAPLAPARKAAPVAAARKGDGLDEQGVAYGYGDYRKRAAVAKSRRDEDTAPKRERTSALSQMVALPGTSFEDIFAPRAAEMGVALTNVTI